MAGSGLSAAHPGVLERVLAAIEAAGGAIALDELARGLGVERGALDGMIEHWVRKGRLRYASGGACADGPAPPAGCRACPVAACCAGPSAAGRRA